MREILYQAGSYILLIILGSLLKKAGFFKETDFKVLSKILLNISLPCAIIYNYSHITLEASMLFLSVFSLLCGLGLILMGMLTAKLSGHRENMTFDAVNMSAFNIGNFCLPFAQSFLSPLSLLSLNLFDVGNAVYANGATKAAGALIQNHLRKAEGPDAASGFSWKGSLGTILHTLSHSVPFVTYIIMSVISLCRIPVPEFIVSFTFLGFKANPFIAMLMVGVGFKLKINRESLAHIFRILSVRYLVTIGLAVLSYMVLPFALETRQALVLAFLSPMANSDVAYTSELGEDYEMASTINSISMLLSIGLITTALLFLL
jgi:hypothetical protein